MAAFDDATLGVDAGESTPDFNAKRNSAPKTRKVQFGDGYEQRMVFGLFQNPKIWDLTWTAKSNTVADAIEAFFDGLGGQQSFTWIPLDESSSSKFIVESWSRDFVAYNINTITATFKQVFEP